MAETANLTKKKARAMTVKSMKALGVYKKEYDGIIDIYAGLIEQYAVLTAEFEAGGRQCVASTADGGEKKSPLVATLESLRKDILQYSDRLTLNPKAHTKQQESGTPPNKKSLMDALVNLNG